MEILTLAFPSVQLALALYLNDAVVTALKVPSIQDFGSSQPLSNALAPLVPQSSHKVMSWAFQQRPSPSNTSSFPQFVTLQLVHALHV